MDLKAHIRDIPDFPKPGILFRDITPLLGNPAAMQYGIDQLAEQVTDYRVDYIVGIESRGFIFGMPLAYKLGVGFAPVRKPGKLPAAVHAASYALEYGSDTLEMHTDALQPGQRVWIVDDLLATGGTVGACCRLVEHYQAQIAGCLFCIELVGLAGREKLTPYRIQSLLKY